MKPKTLDERVTDSVRETLGNCQLQMLRLQAENDMLRERIAELEDASASRKLPVSTKMPEPFNEQIPGYGDTLTGPEGIL